MAAGLLLGGCAGGAAPTVATPESGPSEPGVGGGRIDAHAFAAPDVADPKPQTLNVFGEMNGAGATKYRGAIDSGFQQHTFADEGFDTDAAVDPSGKWMVFASTRHSLHPHLYLQRVDGQSVTQLTGENADDAYPTFSPDGRSIAFSSTRTGSWQVYVMDTDGRNVTQVTNGPGQCVRPSFSPDGTRLVYGSLGGRSGQWELWVANLATGEKKMVGYGLFPSWSPDRTVDRIAFQRARQRGSRWFGLWTIDLVDGEARRVTEVVASTNAAVVAPTWSPDGKKLAFATVVNPDAKGRSGQQDVWTVNADGSNRQRLTDGSGVNMGPAWAADNRVFFVSNRGGTESIWSTRTDGRHEMTAGLVKPGMFDSAPSADATLTPAVGGAAGKDGKDLGTIRIKIGTNDVGEATE
ncbi:MAG TPA: hypothetical protein VK324_12395 [Tepidisphaeraceae bacterium]|nr:hypothetical protein [Tepidisphaeraceae bacterium]